MKRLVIHAEAAVGLRVQDVTEGDAMAKVVQVIELLRVQLRAEGHVVRREQRDDSEQPIVGPTVDQQRRERAAIVEMMEDRPSESEDR